jgi:hypothetical protein
MKGFQGTGVIADEGSGPLAYNYTARQTIKPLIAPVKNGACISPERPHTAYSYV